jgi:hypothetical protein
LIIIDFFTVFENPQLLFRGVGLVRGFGSLTNVTGVGRGQAVMEALRGQGD